MSDPIPQGIHVGMPEKVYRAAPGISQSALKRMLPTPAHFVSAMANPEPPTRAMALGTALHRLVLQPELPQEWVEKPADFDGRTKAGKEWMAALKPDQEAFTVDEAKQCRGMRDSIMAHPIARRILDDSDKREVSCFLDGQVAVEGMYGLEDYQPVRRKCLVDILADSYIGDLKTTLDASEDAFSKSIFDLGYCVQASFYLDLVNALDPANERIGFVFVAVEKEPPFAVAVYELDEASLAYGRRQYQRLLERYAQCVYNKKWPAYPEKCVKVGVPEWVLRREQ